MGSNVDDAKGRVKEAAGDLTNNDDLKKEGKADQAGAKVKEVAEDVKDKVEGAVDAVKDKLREGLTGGLLAGTIRPCRDPAQHDRGAGGAGFNVHVVHEGMHDQQAPSAAARRWRPPVATDPGR